MSLFGFVEKRNQNTSLHTIAIAQHKYADYKVIFWFVGGLNSARIRGKVALLLFSLSLQKLIVSEHKSGFQLEARLFKPIMTSIVSISLSIISLAFFRSAEIHAVLLIVIYVCVIVLLFGVKKRIDCRRRLYYRRSIATNVAILLLISQRLLFIKRIV